MKKFVAFIKWHWSNWDTMQKIWLLGGFFFGAGIADYHSTGEPGLALKIAGALWIVVFAKWFVWDTITDSWKRFEHERKDLFNTIDKGK